MKFFKKLRKQPKTVMEVTALPIIINPDHYEGLKFAHYRSDAIAREIQQRVEESRDKHPEHDQMVAEAHMYGLMLVKANIWTQDKLDELLKRLY